MDETYQTKAIILNRKPFRENDTKVSVFCLKKGRLELVARGAKKVSSKLAGHIEPIILANIMVIRGKRYDYLGSAINENSFLNIKNDLDKLSIAGKAVNVFQKLIKENEKDEKLFKLLEDFLETLNNYELRITNYELFFYFFVMKLLVELGYTPELYNCVVCKKKIEPGNNKFNLNKGGVAHNTCLVGEQSSLTITDNCIKVLRMVVNDDLKKLTKLKIDSNLNKEVKKISSSFYKFNF